MFGLIKSFYRLDRWFVRYLHSEFIHSSVWLLTSRLNICCSHPLSVFTQYSVSVLTRAYHKNKVSPLMRKLYINDYKVGCTQRLCVTMYRPHSAAHNIHPKSYMMMHEKPNFIDCILYICQAARGSSSCWKRHLLGAAGRTKRAPRLVLGRFRSHRTF